MEIFEFVNPQSSIVLIQPVDDHDLEGIENEIAEIVDTCNTSFCLIAIKVDEWNHDLTPWQAPAVFGKENFGGKASKTLEELLKLCSDKRKTYYIGGYSLAGLFALWATYQTDVFSGVAAASPSLWFPGFDEYMEKNKMKTDAVYLSLGDREEKVRNSIMATVGVKMRKAYRLLEKENVKSILEWNEGNHFKDSDIRSAKAFAWIINNTTEED